MVHIYCFFSSRRRHTRYWRDWSSDVCSSDLSVTALVLPMLLLAHWLLRARTPAHERVFKVLSGAMVVLLFVIVASALQRMYLYTQQFGLTELRLYATIFMLWISVVLVWFVVRSEEHTSELQSRQY